MNESEELEIARRNYLAATARADSLSTETRLLREENDRLRKDWLQLADRLDEIGAALAKTIQWIRPVQSRPSADLEYLREAHKKREPT